MRKYLILVALSSSFFFVLQMCSSFRPERGPDVTLGRQSRTSQLRSAIIAYAQEHLGAKYRYGGKDPRGFDCSGFTGYVMRKFDILLPASSKLQAKVGSKVDPREVQAGDLVFFKRNSGGKIFHVSLVLSNDREGLVVIHSTSRGVVIDNVSVSGYWKNKIFSARNVVGP